MTQITSTTALDPALGQRTPNRFNELSSEDFMKIIFTELENQDPLQPNDTSALLDQLNSIRSIESDVRLTDQLQALVRENQLAAASSMIGKHVNGLTADFKNVSGIAVAARREGDTISLELDTGDVVPIENISSIVAPSAGANPAVTG